MGRKGYRGLLDNYQKSFMSILEKIDKSKRSGEVFTDWAIMSSAALYNWKKNMDVENEYLLIEKKYSKAQLKMLAELLSYTVLALDENKKDFLGDIYMELNLGNKRLSQFFTPSSISILMAKMSLDEDMIKSGRTVSIMDPCCGSGGMLISSADVVEEYGGSYENILLVGQDIDDLCAHMTFIQLNILKIPAIVKCGNSLTDDFNWSRETIWYHIYKIKDKMNKRDKEDDLIEVKNKLELQLASV
jgi:type I restriction-modification system DNA methylase subunit